MSPELKSNLLLSGLAAVVITFIFYFWSRKDTERPTVRTHVKVLISSFGVNFLLFYALHKKMIPSSVTGCPAMSGGAISPPAPWSPVGSTVSNSCLGTQADPNDPTKVDMNSSFIW